jgi:hypothetical protein
MEVYTSCSTRNVRTVMRSSIFMSKHQRISNCFDPVDSVSNAEFPGVHQKAVYVCVVTSVDFAVAKHVIDRAKRFFSVRSLDITFALIWMMVMMIMMMTMITMTSVFSVRGHKISD